MAEEAQEAQDAAAGGSKKTIIIFAVVLLLAVGGSVGGTLFFLSSDDAAAEAPVEPVSDKPQTAIYHNLRPPFVINYLTGSKPRYLQAELSIMAREPAAIEAVITHMPLIRSEIVGYLTEQNFIELQTQEGKESVRQGVVEIVNKTLKQYNVSPGIEAALLTNFVLQ